MNHDGAENRRLTVIRGDGSESATARKARETQQRFEAKQAEKVAKAKQAEHRRQQLSTKWEAVHESTKHRVELTTEPASIRELKRVINACVLLNTYVRAGRLVVVETPSGTSLDEGESDQVIEIVGSDILTRLLAEDTFTYKVAGEKLPDGSREAVPQEAAPPERVLRAVLSAKKWELRSLRAIVTAPAFRTDGSLVQTPGYDEVAEVIYSPTLPMELVPDVPTDSEVWRAKAFLFEELLADFPWVGPSRTNFIGMLVAPLMRGYLGGVLVPLLAIDATSPGTGKSLLSDILKGAYSGFVRPWVPKDDELRKAITSMLVDNGGAVICLDNVGKGDVVDQATLAALLTMKVWSDRLLGISGVVRVPNDRLWVVTGNSLSIGGDIASRTVLVRLDAQQPDPSKRPTSKFALGDLEQWLADPDNRASMLRHLLVLVRRWIVDGAQRIEKPMRTFTTWASATAGFLDWMGEQGFLDNGQSLTEVDEEEAEYGAFYARWHHLFGNKVMTVAELRESAVTDEFGAARRDWASAFLVRRDGQVPSVKSLGKMLTSERGRFRGGYRLNGHYDGHAKTWRYSVIPAGQDLPEGAQ